VGLLTGGSSLFFVAAAAAGTVIVPWTRILVCRDHFFVASAVLGITASIRLVLSGTQLHPP
jgi:hypothetical protein